MAFVDDVNRILRDHFGYTGDGQGGIGPLPVGDRSTPRKQIDNRDLRELLIALAQTLGDPSALQEILDDIAAAIRYTPVILTNVGGTSSAMTAEIPAALGLTSVPIGMPVILRAVGVNPGPVELQIVGSASLPVLDGRGRQLVGAEFTGATPLMLRPSGDDGSGGPTEYRIMSALIHPADLAEETAARLALRNASSITLTNVGGTASDITADIPEGIGIGNPLVGMRFALAAIGANPGPVSLKIGESDPLPVRDADNRDLVGGEFSALMPFEVRRMGAGNGTHYRITSGLIQPADLALVAAAAASALQRANHTGTQPINTVAGLPEALDGLSQSSIDRDAAEAEAREAADDALASALAVGGFVPLVDVGGTGDAITASLHPFAIAAGITISTQTKAVLIPTATNTGDVTLEVPGDGERSVRDNAGNQLPGGFVQPGRFLLLSRHIAGAAGHWRVLNDVSRADLAAALAELRGDLSISVADVFTVAALAEERAQAAEATANLNRETIQTLLSRLAALEAGNKEETEMTSYPVSITATASPSVVIAEGPVQLIELYNHSDSVRIGLSFGTPAATFGASHYTLQPGGATDPKLIFSTPIYAITDGGEATLNGAFGTPLNNPNPNWEADFQVLMARLGGGASLAWIEAYRRLYSALRRDKVLERVRGFYALAGHSQQAMLVNWAAENSATVGSGAPVFTPKQGVLFNGASHLDTGVSMGALGVTTTTASAGVWPGFEDQAIGAAALGDGVFELHPNRSPTEVGSRGWAASTSVDISASPGLGSFMGAVRVAQPNFTVYVGGSGEIETRDYTSGYPVRPVYIGATNQSTGVGKHYSGLIRGAMFGLSLSAVQMLAARNAMTRFFKDIEAA